MSTDQSPEEAVGAAKEYPAEWHDFYEAGMLDSARKVVPLVMGLVQPRSVIDVGCGRGGWLRVFKENGISRCLGLDGAYVDRSKLLIDQSEFGEVDLERPMRIEERYDLAVCLEVAEHLSPASADTLVSTLTQVAPVVLFSAAVPGQGGSNHVNLRWHSYWKARFSELGYRCLDPVRRELWQDSGVDYWYRQNIFLFASDEAIARSPGLLAEHRLAVAEDLDLIHVGILEAAGSVLDPPPLTLRTMLRELPGALRRATASRVRRLTKRFARAR